MTLGKLQVRGVYAWLLVGGLGLLLLLLVGIQVGGWVLARSLSEPVRVASSPLVVDRQGRLLRAFTVADGRWRLPVTLAEVDPLFLSLLLTFEDRRFYHHGGVDYLALARAVGQLIVNGRVVSGASTLTMQTARLLHGQSSRGVAGKLRQMVQALALERRLDKAAILERYLHLAPYGGNLEGIRAASLAWFGLEPRRLTPAQAALLVALPQAPEARRPDRDPEAARRARDRVLARALAAGILDAETVAAARREPVPRQRLPFPLLAPHATQRARLGHPERPVQRLALAADLQARLEGLAAERGRLLGGKLSLALLVADHRSGEILAAVGSPGLEAAREGFIDMTRVVRSPGSTLKPLIYGLAFEAGIAHPESLIEDRPAGFGRYVPANFDRDYQGTVTLRRALQLSLNIPAVKLLEAVGPARLVARLRRAGARPELPDLSPPGLAIGLGGVGLRLTDLVAVYGAIARGGRPMPLVEELPMATRGGLDDTGSAPSQGTGGTAQASPGDDRLRLPVLDERAAWQVTDILAAAPPPEAANTAGLAFKTGTSYGYRDAWALGFDGRHVVGVWVGRPDGAPVPGLTGITAAAPLLVDVFARLGPRHPLPPAPPGVLRATTASLPPPLRRVDEPAATAGPRIAFPPAGARLALGAGLDAELALKVRDGQPPFTWFANGTPIAHEPFARVTPWRPQGAGFVTLAVVDAQGRSGRVRVFLEPGP
ncbi:MAG TPA: penicillin-binding protein 1C [Chromatiaceae bacterium]|nr:penicillin-binding protein 1C [Chromatiaceae bacterium]